MNFIEILELQQRIPTFSFDPRPDRFNWIEIRWARRQESWSGSTICQKLLNLFTPVSPVIIHYYYFIKKLMISFILLIKVFDCFNIGWVSDWMRQHIAVYTDSTNDSHIIYHIEDVICSPTKSAIVNARLAGGAGGSGRHWVERRRTDDHDNARKRFVMLMLKVTSPRALEVICFVFSNSPDCVFLLFFQFLSHKKRRGATVPHNFLGWISR